MIDLEIELYDNVNNRTLKFKGLNHQDEYDLLYIKGSLDVPVEDNLALISIKLDGKEIWRKRK